MSSKHQAAVGSTDSEAESVLGSESRDQVLSGLPETSLPKSRCAPASRSTQLSACIDPTGEKEKEHALWSQAKPRLDSGSASCSLCDFGQRSLSVLIYTRRLTMCIFASIDGRIT